MRPRPRPRPCLRRRTSAVALPAAAALALILTGCTGLLPNPRSGASSGWPASGPATRSPDAGAARANAAAPSANAPTANAPSANAPSANAPTAKASAASTAHEVPTPPGPRERTAGAGSPVAAIRAFAMTYINWNAADVAARLTTLARASVGQARTEMSLAAAQTSGDQQLAEGGIANQGTVEAVAPLAGRAGEYVVVTRESTTATNTTAYQGLAPAWHLTLATVSRLPGGVRWAVSGWQPES